MSGVAKLARVALGALVVVAVAWVVSACSGANATNAGHGASAVVDCFRCEQDVQPIVESIFARYVEAGADARPLPPVAIDAGAPR